MTLKICKFCKQEKSLDNLYKDKKLSDGHSSDCKECVKNRVARHKKENREKVLENKRQYNTDNKERQAVWHKEWRDRNRDYFNQKSLQWSKQNSNRRAEIIHKSYMKNRILTPRQMIDDDVCHVRKRRATPKWPTKDQRSDMKRIELEAILLTQITKIPHEADHINAIAGRGCCGLHVPWNLQIVTRNTNRRKSNKI